MMWKDPIIEETRRMKDEYAAKFNYDLQAIYQDLKELEKQLPEAQLIRTQTTVEIEAQAPTAREAGTGDAQAKVQ